MGWMCPPAMAIGRAVGMPQRCSGMLRGCFGCANAAVLPILLSVKQGQDIYLVGQLLLPPSCIRHICTEQRSCSHGAARANAELSIVSY